LVGTVQRLSFVHRILKGEYRAVLDDPAR